LQREQPEQSECDAIEQRAVVTLERGVEKRANDLRERQTDSRGNHETERGHHESPAIRTNERE